MVWKPGQSGNLNGRPPSSRQKIAETLIRDISAEWERSGGDALARLAKDDPGKFVQVAAGLIPKDILLSIQAPSIGGLEAEDLRLLQAVFAAIKAAMPDASERPPAEVLAYVEDAIRAHGSTLIAG